MMVHQNHRLIDTTLNVHQFCVIEASTFELKEYLHTHRGIVLETQRKNCKFSILQHNSCATLLHLKTILIDIPQGEKVKEIHLLGDLPSIQNRNKLLSSQIMPNSSVCFICALALYKYWAWQGYTRWCCYSC